MKPAPKALIIALVYAGLGALWVVASDRALEMRVDDPAMFHVLQTAKGLFFIGVTGLALYLLVWRILRFRVELADRALAEAALQERKESFEALAEHAPDIIVRFDRELRHVYVNSRLEELTGMPREEFIGRTNAELGYGSEVVEIWNQPLRQALEGGESQSFAFEFPDRHGTLRVFEARVVPEFGAGGRIESLLSMVRDMTDLRRSEERVIQLTKLYAALSAANQAIIRTTDRAALFKELCDIAVSYGGLKMAWIGLVEGSEWWVEPAAWAGVGAEYLEQVRVSADPERPEGRGPVGRSIATERPCVFNDFLHDPDARPWHKAAGRYGFRAVAGFPLHEGGRVVGALAVYAREADYFTGDIVGLMEELARDISFALDYLQREEDRRRLEEDLQLNSKVFEHSGESIVIADAEDRIVKVNRAFTEITGYRPEDVLGSEWGALRVADRGDAGPDRIKEWLREHGEWHGEVWSRRKNSEVYPEWLSMNVVRDAGGAITHYISVAFDLTERREQEEHIRYLAQHDLTTGLPNRALVADRLEQGMARMQQRGARLAVLFLDLDRFKVVNDSLGHRVGDRLLQQVAVRLVNAVRETDTVSRQGGDEFLILLPDLEDADDAAQVARNMVAALAKPFDVEGQQLVVTPSIGISIYPDDETDRDALIRYAEAAMYGAKSEGRNRYRFFTADMNERARERLDLETSLRAALENSELEVWYQPQVALAGGAIVGLEALLRWRHPQRGLVSPGEFIPVAEESRMILPIGEWVVDEVCRQQVAWRREELPDLPVAVNLSAVQLQQKGLDRFITGRLRAHGLDPSALQFEITESVFLGDADPVRAALEGLEREGLALAVDDFGTGYSNLGYLKRMPVAKLKIDQSFIRDLESDPDDAAITRAIISIAHNMRLKVVAEGVETPGQLSFLRRHGCDELQGFLFSPPLPADECRALLSDPPQEWAR